MTTMKSQKKTISQKDKRHELEILEKACEMERNFQKARWQMVSHRRNRKRIYNFSRNVFFMIFCLCK